MDTGEVVDNLTFSERIELIKTFSLLRSQAPMGAVGLIEFRNLLADQFPEFASVRDVELDAFLENYTQEIMSPIPKASPLGED